MNKAVKGVTRQSTDAMEVAQRRCFSPCHPEKSREDFRVKADIELGLVELKGAARVNGWCWGCRDRGGEVPHGLAHAQGVWSSGKVPTERHRRKNVEWGAGAP